MRSLYVLGNNNSNKRVYYQIVYFDRYTAVPFYLRLSS